MRLLGSVIEIYSRGWATSDKIAAFTVLWNWNCYVNCSCLPARFNSTPPTRSWTRPTGCARAPAMAGSVEDGVAGLCLWGRFEAASLLQVQQGFYHVRFGSGGETRWATAAELALPDHPVTVYSAPVDSTVLVPVSDSPTSVAYAHATVLRHLPPRRRASRSDVRCCSRRRLASCARSR